MGTYQVAGNKYSLTEKIYRHTVSALLYLILTSVNVPFSILQEKIAQGLK